MSFFEDYEVGQVDRFGHYEVTREEVLAFATAYDPQPFHLDDEAAAASPIFGRLAASGWHTAGMAMRMMVDRDRELGHTSSMGSPGLDELRWLKPVYPGDTLSVEIEIIGKSEPKSLPDMGFVKKRTIVFNQHGEPVMRHVSSIMHRKRAG
jgi:acyl dehydratase